MTALRYGVIGTGMMGCEHLRNLAALPLYTLMLGVLTSNDSRRPL